MTDDSMAAACRALKAGKVVAYPTDTLLGLAVSAYDARALSRLFEVKRRPEGTPVSLAVSSWEEIEPLADLDLARRRWVRDLLPGPRTLLLPPSRDAQKRLPRSIIAPQGTLGIRIPDHPLARELARQVGPITSTSANRHGEPPCRTPEAARRAFGREVACYLPALPPPSGEPSLLIDLTGSEPKVILRH